MPLSAVMNWLYATKPKQCQHRAISDMLSAAQDHVIRRPASTGYTPDHHNGT